jgi:hypothetical protein
MKKLFTGILAFLYLSTSLGATIHIHYCMGKLISWSFANQESKNCSNCGMLKNTSGEQALSSDNHCCNDVQKEIRTTNDQKLPQAEFHQEKRFTDAIVMKRNLFVDEIQPAQLLFIPPINAPPLSDDQAIYLLNRNFRI